MERPQRRHPVGELRPLPFHRYRFRHDRRRHSDQRDHRLRLQLRSGHELARRLRLYAHPNTHADIHLYADVNVHAEQHTDLYLDAVAYKHANGNEYADEHRYRHQHADRNPYTDRYGHAHRHRDANGHAYADGYTYRDTPTATDTSTDTPTPSDTPTPTDTATATDTYTPTNTATSTNTATFTPTPTDTSTPTYTPTNTNTPTPTFTPTTDPCDVGFTGTINIGGPDGSFYTLICGQSIIVDLGPSNLLVTRPGYDFVYYERDNGVGGIYMDSVQVEVCTNASCSTAYVVYTWPPASDNQLRRKSSLWKLPAPDGDSDRRQRASAIRHLPLHSPVSTGLQPANRH